MAKKKNFYHRDLTPFEQGINDLLDQASHVDMKTCLQVADKIWQNEEMTSQLQSFVIGKMRDLMQWKLKLRNDQDAIEYTKWSAEKITASPNQIKDWERKRKLEGNVLDDFHHVKWFALTRRHYGDAFEYNKLHLQLAGKLSSDHTHNEDTCIQFVGYVNERLISANRYKKAFSNIQWMKTNKFSDDKVFKHLNVIQNKALDNGDYKLAAKSLFIKFPKDFLKDSSAVQELEGDYLNNNLLPLIVRIKEVSLDKGDLDCAYEHNKLHHTFASHSKNLDEGKGVKDALFFSGKLVETAIKQGELDKAREFRNWGYINGLGVESIRSDFVKMMVGEEHRLILQFFENSQEIKKAALGTWGPNKLVEFNNESYRMMDKHSRYHFGGKSEKVTHLDDFRAECWRFTDQLVDLSLDKNNLTLAHTLTDELCSSVDLLHLVRAAKNYDKIADKYEQDGDIENVKLVLNHQIDYYKKAREHHPRNWAENHSHDRELFYQQSFVRLEALEAAKKNPQLPNWLEQIKEDSFPLPEKRGKARRLTNG